MALRTPRYQSLSKPCDIPQYNNSLVWWLAIRSPKPTWASVNGSSPISEIEHHSNPERHFLVNGGHVSFGAFAELPRSVMQDSNLLAPAPNGPPRHAERSSDFLLETTAVFQALKKLLIRAAVNPARNAERFTPAIDGARRNRELLGS